MAPKSYIMLFFIPYSVTPNGLSLLLLPLGSPWIYIHYLTLFIFYFLFHIRWHQNLTLCYFLFSIQWHQKGSVCFTPSNITMNIFLHYVIIDLVFGGTKRAKFASPPLTSPWTSPWIYILHCNYLFCIRWHRNLTLCYFLFSIRWHQKGSVCFWHLASPWIYSYVMLFFI